MSCTDGHDKAKEERDSLMRSLWKQCEEKLGRLVDQAADALGIEEPDYESEYKYETRRQAALKEMARVLDYVGSRQKPDDTQETWDKAGIRIEYRDGKYSSVYAKVTPSHPYLEGRIGITPDPGRDDRGELKLFVFEAPKDSSYRYAEPTTENVAHVVLTRIEGVSRLVDALPRLMETAGRISDQCAKEISSKNDYARGVLEALEAL